MHFTVTASLLWNMQNSEVNDMKSKKTYETVKITVSSLTEEDVITTSAFEGEEDFIYEW